MSDLYGHVSDGAVVEGPRTLPTSWRTEDAEILAFDRLADPTPYGWWPWVGEPAPAFDPATHRLEASVALDEPGRRIVRSLGVVALTPEEIAAANPVPDGPTNSDWRVGLRIWGRFSEVEAAVIAARDSGTLEGAIAWDRFEYANHVYRAELMRLKDVFGFSAADVDESLHRAAAVAAQAMAQSEG